MTPLEEICRLAPPPADPFPLPVPDPGLPDDYATLLATYGHGGFCDLIVLGELAKGLLKGRLPKRERPYPIRPKRGGLLPWAQTSNGDVLCWLTTGAPDSWPVVIWSRSNEFEEHPMGATAFLAGWLSGRVTSDLLPSQFREHAQWFDSPRELSHVSVMISPHTQALDTFRAAIGHTTLRRSVDTQHIVATGNWCFTYNPRYLEIAFPPQDSPQVQETVHRIAAALGCDILSTTDFDGEPVWNEP